MNKVSESGNSCEGICLAVQQEPESITLSNVNEFLNIDVELYNLLVEWDLTALYSVLQENDITFASLKYLSSDDIRDAIKSIGLRAQFREKLFIWRKEKYGIEDETLSLHSKVLSWLQSLSDSIINNSSTATASPITSYVDQPFLSTDLTSTLKISNKGRAILAFYEKESYLLENHRQDLISIILEDINCSGNNLTASNFIPITEKILELFPNECKDYYFVPRQGKRNPGGKLYDKYVYARRKRKLHKPSTSKSADLVYNTTIETEADETVLKSLKKSLSRDVSDWNEVKDKWEKTFVLRQKELKLSKSNLTFFADWPKYKDARASDLVSVMVKCLIRKY